LRVARGDSAKRVQIVVRDGGFGIAASDRDRIFEPFFRGEDAQARQIRGSGLGLSLVRRIVDAHAGHISVTSAPGQGSTFIVDLPVAGEGKGTAPSVRLEEETLGTPHSAR
jgi:signal transduction histidine kinase